ncbi:uncharacterized protein LOC136036315 [Artemia franciscana]|uniref:uncharacterized protein LOC136036315 n=1 Tax=Artemia franciscana TaxID=6661 RepID=UPI0032DB187F
MSGVVASFLIFRTHGEKKTGEEDFSVYITSQKLYNTTSESKWQKAKGVEKMSEEKLRKSRDCHPALLCKKQKKVIFKSELRYNNISLMDAEVDVNRKKLWKAVRLTNRINGPFKMNRSSLVEWETRLVTFRILVMILNNFCMLIKF